MDQQSYKEVYYHQYCPTCKHRKVKNVDEPCDECLSEPLNWNTHRPVNYEEKDTTKHSRTGGGSHG